MSLAAQMLALLPADQRAAVLESDASLAAKREARIAARTAARMAEMERRYPHLRAE